MIFLPPPDPDFAEKQSQEFQAMLEAGSDKSKNFSLYAQDPGRWAHLETRIPKLLMHSAGGLCPFQAEGFIAGFPFYYRYEYGSATLKLGHWGVQAMPYGWDNTLWSGSFAIGDENAVSHETPGEFEDSLVGCLENLHLAPMLWHFACHEVVTDGDEQFRSGAMTSTSALGYTPCEALDRITTYTPYPYGDKPNFRAYFEKRMELMEVSPVPLNRDERDPLQPIPQLLS